MKTSNTATMLAMAFAIFAPSIFAGPASNDPPASQLPGKKAGKSPDEQQCFGSLCARDCQKMGDAEACSTWCERGDFRVGFCNTKAGGCPHKCAVKKPEK